MSDPDDDLATHCTVRVMKFDSLEPHWMAHGDQGEVCTRTPANHNISDSYTTRYQAVGHGLGT